MKLTLPRLEDSGFATYGHLINAEQKEICKTLELPWLGNRHNVSCVPAGLYVAEREYSTAHHRALFWLRDVPDRDDVEVHIGCLPRDTKGCILLGSAFGFVDYDDGKPGASGHGITGSRIAFEKFMLSMTGINRFELDILTSPSPTEKP